jgi:hypothetical protein
MPSLVHKCKADKSLKYCTEAFQKDTPILIVFISKTHTDIVSCAECICCLLYTLMDANSWPVFLLTTKAQFYNRVTS